MTEDSAAYPEKTKTPERRSGVFAFRLTEDLLFVILG